MRVIRSCPAGPGEAVTGSRCVRIIGDLPPRRASLVDWAFAPAWVTFKQASFLSGHDAETLLWLIEDGALDAKNGADGWLIETLRLREFQETLLELAHWKD